MIETVLIVFAALSVIAFFLYASDKRKAKKKKEVLQQLKLEIK